MIAVGALKFTILKRSPGHDIIFDMREALSLEGDSGPYLQYTATRANSVLEKARAVGIEPAVLKGESQDLERLLVRFPNIVAKARENLSPQIIVDYLLELAGSFNNFYNRVIIVDESVAAPDKVALVLAGHG